VGETQAQLGAVVREQLRAIRWRCAQQRGHRAPNERLLLEARTRHLEDGVEDLKTRRVVRPVPSELRPVQRDGGLIGKRDQRPHLLGTGRGGGIDDHQRTPLRTGHPELEDQPAPRTPPAEERLDDRIERGWTVRDDPEGGALRERPIDDRARPGIRPPPQSLTPGHRGLRREDGDLLAFRRDTDHRHGLAVEEEADAVHNQRKDHVQRLGRRQRVSDLREERQFLLTAFHVRRIGHRCVEGGLGTIRQVRQGHSRWHRYTAAATAGSDAVGVGESAAIPVITGPAVARASGPGVKSLRDALARVAAGDDMSVCSG